VIEHSGRRSVTHRADWMTEQEGHAQAPEPAYPCRLSPMLRLTAGGEIRRK